MEYNLDLPENEGRKLNNALKGFSRNVVKKNPISAELFEFEKSNLPEFSFIDSFNKELCERFVRQMDDLIKDALVKIGVDPANTEFLKANLSRIIVEGDKFDHYYLYFDTPEEVRVISIERTHNIINDIGYNFSHKETISARYY